MWFQLIRLIQNLLPKQLVKWLIDTAIGKIVAVFSGVFVVGGGVYVGNMDFSNRSYEFVSSYNISSIEGNYEGIIGKRPASLTLSNVGSERFDYTFTAPHGESGKGTYELHGDSLLLDFNTKTWFKDNKEKWDC